MARTIPPISPRYNDRSPPIWPALYIAIGAFGLLAVEVIALAIFYVRGARWIASCF